jgi:hypothetical protein
MVNQFITMQINKLETKELIAAYSEIIFQLKERKIIRSKNLLGDLAEFLVIDYYCNTPKLPNLQTAPTGTKNVDALSRNGERYSIKATTGNLTGSFWGLNPPDDPTPDLKKFEYLIIACFDENLKLNKILQATWETFIKHKSWNKTMRCWKITTTKKFINDCKIIFNNTI